MKEVVKKFWPLILAVLVAFCLRTYRLGEHPIGLTWDEPALGYNAYSILKTARDEYGQLLPITFKSFGDHKPGLSIYFMVPWLAVFGLTKFGIRFPSALAGTMAVVAIYFLVKEFFWERKEKTKLANLSACLLAISPWQIQFSRGAWEANLALLTIILSILFFLKAIRLKKKRFIFLSFLFLTASFYTYHGAKVFLVPFLSGAFFLLGREIKKLPQRNKKIGLALLLLLLLPLSSSFMGSANRARVVTLFSYRRPATEIDNLLVQEEFLPKLNFYLYHSEFFNFVRGVAERYYNHLTARFLFFQGDWASPRHSVPYMGMMYYVEMPLLLLGLGALLKKKKTVQERLLLWWLLAGPVPAAVTRDIIHGLRSYWMVVPLVILTGLGVNNFLSWLKTKERKLVLVGTFGLVIGYLLCLVFYLDLYYFNFPQKNSAGWNYGTERIAEIIDQGKDKYEKIIMTQEYGQPYIFYLFYSRYPPQDYQPQAKLKPNPYGDAGMVEKVDNIDFRNSYWPTDKDCRNCLIIDDLLALNREEILREPGAKLLETISFLDGKIAYVVVETNPE